MKYNSFLFNKILSILIIFVLFKTSYAEENDIEKNEVLNIHVVPHTHDDPGWLFSFDNYYLGQNRMGCVKCILDTFINALSNNPERTFTYVEMSFFEKWYTNLVESDKLKIKSFVENKKLEFLNGGWVMNDEAATNYQHIIDQMRLGMQFLKREFDVIPRIAWFIDPFGHSLSNPYLIKNLGFENLVITRVDFRDKEKRKIEKKMEFIWKPYNFIDNGKTSILTHITYNHYCPDGKIYDNAFTYKYSENEVKIKLESIYQNFVENRKAYKTNEILFLWGDDFTFRDSTAFENIELIIKLFKESEYYKDKINVFYSTPSRYFNILNEKIKKEKINLPEYLDNDFFPYADNNREYWTGYFTSRPYLKGIIKDAGNYLIQTSQFIFNNIINIKKELFDMEHNKINSENFLNIKKKEDEFKKNHQNKILLEENYNSINNNIILFDTMRRELALSQHHDGASGTARNNVSDDYISRLENGISSLSKIVKNILEKEKYLNHLKIKELGKYNLCLDSIAYLSCVENVFEESDIEKGILLISINSGIRGKYPKKIKINFNLANLSNKKLSLKTINIENNLGTTKIEYDLFFDDKLNYYFVYYNFEFRNDSLYQSFLLKFETIKSREESIELKIIKPQKINGNNSVENAFKVFDEKENNLKFYFENNKITFKQFVKENKKIDYGLNNVIEEEYLFSLSHGYFSYIQYGKNRQGAYLMATNEERPTNYNLDYNNSYVISGKILTQITVRFENSSILIKIYHLQKKKYTYEIESILHKYEPQDQKEFVLIVNSNINNIFIDSKSEEKTEFYTDSNAMRMIKRLSNYRETFDLDPVEEKPAGNFYPINSLIYISDNEKNEKKLFMFNDRAQGATSTSKGEIFIDINRWSNKDDNRGLADGLYEFQSSRHHFSVNHVLAVSDYYDLDNIYEYINKKPLTAIYYEVLDKINFINENKQEKLRDLILNKNNNSNITELINSDKAQKNQKLRILDTENKFNINGIDSLFKFGNKKCLEINYFIISNSKIYIQFYNKSDPYLIMYKNCYIKFRDNPHLTYNRYDLNTLEKQKNKVYNYQSLKNKFFVSLDTIDQESNFNQISIGDQEFETILVEFI